jgi:hypothetical protein
MKKDPVPGPEDSVVKADQRHDDESQQEWRQAACPVDIVHVRLEREIERDGDQQKGQGRPKDVTGNGRGQKRANCGARCRERRRRALCLEIDMALAGVGYGCRAGAEQPLKLVGAQRLDRCEAGQQQRRDSNQASAAGYRIDKTRREGRCQQQQGERQRRIFHEIAWGKWCH